MKYLPDTHTLLWVLFEDEKLAKRAQEVIKNPVNEIYVSLITYWEIALKYSIGKLELENITPAEIPQKAKEIYIDTLEISEKDVATRVTNGRLGTGSQW
jgi:PIN domain nuclease of toxin-antitoxin system